MSYSTLTYITGSTITLSCSITEDGNPQATWTWRCGSRTFNSGITNSVGRSNLTFVVTKTDNNQPCTCTASSSVGSYSQTSGPATLDIRYPPHGKPLMSYSTLTYITGSTVTLSCSITENGNPQATWTWKCGSRTFNSGITNSVGRSNLTIVVTETDNNQPCTCTASSTVGSYSQTSDPATLNIQDPPQGKPLMSYSTLTYITGSTVTLSCSITEDGNPQATWTWRCGSRTFNSGITNSVGRSNLTFVVTKTDNNQPCTCTASSSVGSYSQTSGPATLDIRYPPQGKPLMSFSTLTYITGSTVTLSCSITENGNPQATWTWRCGSRTFNSGITNSVGRSNLTFVVTKTDNNQPCTCTASSTVGSYSQTSYPATLNIQCK
ncbi:hypothetical protein FSP39_005209 [Pinctada imbricata]|uniref:Ig-like domain-containing protein n=1 Tax=Pinctada imbricata TaxID=66713 RepID=A0AA88YMC3_PINIB|nr:hypothetical protein FSP39_005209 [Pinctada imbricata]